MNPNEIYQTALAAGFNPDAAVTMTAIALAESGGNPNAHNPNTGTGDNSYGLWQINMLGSMGPARRRQFAIANNNDLFDPTINARAAFETSVGGKNFTPWTTYKTGAYRQYYAVAQQAAQGNAGQEIGAGGVAGQSAQQPPKAQPQDLGSQLKQATDIATAQKPTSPLDAPVASPTSGQTTDTTQQQPAPEPQPTSGGTNPTADAAIKSAMSAIGKPYIWGGNDLNSGVDCSGLIQQAYKAAGVNLPRVSNQQIQAGVPVDPKDMQPGDVLGWAYNSSLGGGATHVAMYIGGGKMIEALHQGSPVQIVNVRAPQFVSRPTAGVIQPRVSGVAPTMQPQNTPQDSLEARLAAIDNAFSSAMGTDPLQGQM